MLLRLRGGLMGALLGLGLGCWWRNSVPVLVDCFLPDACTARHFFDPELHLDAAAFEECIVSC